MSQLSRDDALFMAKVYELAEHYDGFIIFLPIIHVSLDMVECMATIAKLNVNLTVQERTLFAVANKNILASKRQSIRILDAIQEEEERNSQSTHVAITRKLSAHIKAEINSFLTTQLHTIQTDILPFQSSTDGRVFFLKLFVQSVLSAS